MTDFILLRTLLSANGRSTESLLLRHSAAVYRSHRNSDNARVMHTIELILGLRPMSQFGAAAVLL